MDEPHTQKEAEEAIGLRTDNGVRKPQNDEMQVER
jgi:hypothetical protein